MNQPANDNQTVDKARSWMGSIVVLSTLISILVMTLVIVYVTSEKQRGEAAENVLYAVLPMFGSWVGTVLAYYFSKDNFEAANQSVRELTRYVTSREKLSATLVKDTMIRKDEIFFKRLPTDQINLNLLLGELEQAGKGNRIPVLNDQDHPVYMMHRSMIDKYLADKARDNPQSVDVTTLTLENLMTHDTELKALFENSFGTVSVGSNLAAAKDIMDSIQKCQDVFVTAGGNRNEPILGWITDAVIRKHSEVE